MQHARCAPKNCFGPWPPRLGLVAALGNGGTPKLRRGEYVEVAARRAMAHRSSANVSTGGSCCGRAPRIEAAWCDEISHFDTPLSDSSCGITSRLSCQATWRAPCLCKGRDKLNGQLQPFVRRQCEFPEKHLLALHRNAPVPIRAFQNSRAANVNQSLDCLIQELVPRSIGSNRLKGYRYRH